MGLFGFHAQAHNLSTQEPFACAALDIPNIRPLKNKHRLSLFDEMSMVHGVCLTFQFGSCAVTEGRFENKKKMRWHTVAQK